MQLKHLAPCLIAATLLTAPAFAQLGGVGGAKGVVNKELQDAQKQRDEQMNEAMGNKPQPQQQPKPQQQPQPPAASSAAQVPIKQGWITRKSSNGKVDVRLFFAYPEKLNYNAPAAGLVVLQEWWGV